MFCLWLSHASGHLLQCEYMDPAENTYTYRYPQEPQHLVASTLLGNYVLDSHKKSYAQDMFIRKGNGTPLQYSCLENPMDGGAWQAAVHGVTKSWTQLRDFTFTFHFHALEKEMATYSSVLAWRIPGTGEPGGMPSMGSHRVGHD